MPSLSRLFSGARGSGGEDGDQIRAEQIPASLVPLSSDLGWDSGRAQTDRNVGSQPQATVQGSYQRYGMALPQTMEQSKRRADSADKRKEKERSHSHSFSNFFGSGRKKVFGIDTDTDSSEDDEFGTTSTSAKKGKRTLSTRDAEQMFSTGHCMTCRSKVRWPKDLKVYRCTVCYCINDLEPRAQNELRRVKEVDQATVQRLNTRYPGLKYPDAPYFFLAVREARNIAERCAQTYVNSLTRSATSDVQRPNPPSERRPSMDPSKQVQRKPLPSLPSKALSEASPDPEVLLTPPHLTDINDPFTNAEALHSSPEQGTSPRRNWEARQLLQEDEELSRVESGGSLHKAPTRPPPPPPPTAGQASNQKSERNIPGLNHQNRKTSRPAPNESVAPDLGGSSERLKAAFKPLEVYLKWSYGSFESLNQAFHVQKRPGMARSPSAPAIPVEPQEEVVPPTKATKGESRTMYLSEVNGQTLRVGDVAENATLWAGDSEHRGSRKENRNRTAPEKDISRIVSHRSPLIDWALAREWYRMVLYPGKRFAEEGTVPETEIARMRSYTQKLLWRATESLLRRPGRPLKEPEHLRFLMVLLANPLLYEHNADTPGQDKPPATCKRILGLLARSGKRALRYLDGWLSNLDDEVYNNLLSLCKRYMHYRLSKDIIPGESKGDTRPAATIIAQELAGEWLQQSVSKLEGDAEAGLSYFDDWGLGSVGAFMFSLWHANLSRPAPVRVPCHAWYNLFFDSMGENAIKQDFVAWETRKPAFTFCYFPFLISMSAKITILTFDANRQQMDEARKAWHQQFNSVELVSQNFHVNVRRECLAVDSLRVISEAAGSASHHKELKKALKVHFDGEEGVDAGGLRKEFFLMLLRELLDPNHGLVEYDEESNYCYFNPGTFEESAQYFLLGTLVGLAIYNVTILDIPFPPVLFKKLLRRDSALMYAEGDRGTPATNATACLLEDLSRWRPSLAHGLRQLLEYDGDVENDLSLTFSIEVDRYGKHATLPLSSSAANSIDTPVTNVNREEYIKAYVQYALHDSVSRQFEPFKRGFFAVCGGNALSLFQSEELELLVRGSDEPLDVNVLKAVARYEGWNTKEPAERVPVIKWFWEFFTSMEHSDQRKLLGYITGSDRVPALGEANLIIRIQCAGDDVDRLPVARTCFNILQLYKYESEEILKEKLWQAVTESEGFLLK